MKNLSEPERNRIKNDVLKVLEILIAGCESLDMERAFSIFSNSSDFIMMGTDGTTCGYRTYLENNVNYLTACRSFELQTFGKEITIIDEATAILSWSYGVKAVLTTGETDSIEKAGASFIFRRIGKDWKVVYYHESSLPAVRR